jgi:hypothetical protein
MPQSMEKDFRFAHPQGGQISLFRVRWARISFVFQRYGPISRKRIGVAVFQQAIA